MKADLHLHTTHSDGNWSPSDLVAHAIQIGMSVIAVTDHDTVDGIGETLAAANGTLDVIPAVEINTIWIDADGKGQDVHILGYFIDKENRVLLDLLEKQQRARVEQVERLVQLLSADGMPISMQLVRRFSKDAPIGKVHVTQAIVAAGGAPDVTHAYEKYYDRNSKYFVQRKSVSPIEAIQAIGAAGGLTSIAHPAMGEDFSGLIRELARSGLDAIEVYHSAHESDGMEKLRTLAAQLNLLTTGGSDCHGPFQQYPSIMGTVDVPPDVVPRLRAAIASRV